MNRRPYFTPRDKFDSIVILRERAASSSPARSDKFMNKPAIGSEWDSAEVLDLPGDHACPEPAASDFAPNFTLNMAAMIFSDDQQPDPVLSDFATRLMNNNHRVLGLVQHGHCEGPATRELFATLLHNGDDVPLFQNLGSCAMGCKLDVNQLLRAGASISDALANDDAHILIINRFGKLEKEGKGLLFLIEQALSANVPVLIAVPESHLDSWMEFSGGLGDRLACDAAAIAQWWDSFAASAPLRRIA